MGKYVQAGVHNVAEIVTDAATLRLCRPSGSPAEQWVGAGRSHRRSRRICQSQWVRPCHNVETSAGGHSSNCVVLARTLEHAWKASGRAASGCPPLHMSRGRGRGSSAGPDSQSSVRLLLCEANCVEKERALASPPFSPFTMCDREGQRTCKAAAQQPCDSPEEEGRQQDEDQDGRGGGGGEAGNPVRE